MKIQVKNTVSIDVPTCVLFCDHFLSFLEQVIVASASKVSISGEEFPPGNMPKYNTVDVPCNN